MRHGIIFSVLLITFLAALSFSPNAAAAEVVMWEEDVELPTYLVGAPEDEPIFYAGRVYQGAQGRVYPYPLIADIAHENEPRVHRIVYLENEYVKVGLMPGAGGGGRIFSAVDKTTGYDFFYRQNVIKPGLISVLGAWISGGVEWNVPHHHRTSTFLPVDYKLEENPDGSKTVWMGEIEWRHRMKWMVGVTLKPGRSQVEVTGRLYNRTPMVHSFLFFANVAVLADSSYQIIFPPQQQWGTGHGKHEFTRWPITPGSKVLQRDGYSPGDNLSWWKNHPSPISIFAHNSKEEFLAGYSHTQSAGVVHVANPHLVPGKKLWQWGPGDAGRMWDNVLTDKDGPYIELMIGAYSDNQPDYSWIQPFETKKFTMTWWPLAGIGGVKNSTLDAAVNLEPSGSGKLRVAFNTSAAYPAARVSVRAGERVLLDENADISPDSPYSREIKLPKGVTVKDVETSLHSQDGKLLVSYKEQIQGEQPEPEKVTPPQAPEDIKTIEQLFLAGQRLEQFHNAAVAPEPYYEEALRRDRDDYRCNTSLGILAIRHLMFEKAEEHLERAVARITAQHTRARDGEAQYYLGMVRRALGNLDGAADVLFDASWSAAYYAPAFYEIARIDTWKGNYDAALEHLERSLSANLLNNRALCLKAAVLRRSGRADAAAEVAGLLLDNDPLEHWAANELALAYRQMGRVEQAAAVLDSLSYRMRDSFQSYLELAADYGGCGLWDEAVAVLERSLAMYGTFAGYNALGVSNALSLTDGSKAMAYYYLGYCHKMLGNESQAAEYYQQASSQPTTLVFPFRLESIMVLGQALAARPDDPMPCYYLGNLLFDHQPQRALALWEQAAERGGDFSTLHRNIALGYSRIQNDLQLAATSLERAHALEPDDAQILLELDQLYEADGRQPASRLALLEKCQPVVDEHDGILARQIVLYVRQGQFDRAIELLTGHTFTVWEGSGNIHDVWMDALIARGHARLETGEHKLAIEDFRLALSWPVNLAVGRPRDGGREPEVHYHIGRAYAAMGQNAEAKKKYKLAVQHISRPTSQLAYTQALAQRELGQRDKADGIFKALESNGRKMIDGDSVDYFAKFGEKRSENLRMADAHYLLGLGLLGQGEKGAAKDAFGKALELNINHLGAADKLGR
jgi:tetratricopeptide (TPR) repeat protein